MKGRGNQGGGRDRKMAGGREGGKRGSKRGENDRYFFLFSFSFFLILKKLRVAQGYYILSTGFLKKSQKYILLEKSGHKFSVTVVFCTPKCLELHLPLEEPFKSLMPVLSNYLE